MRTRSKLILAGLAATLLMSLAVSTASAAHLRTSSTTFRTTWTSLEFTEPGGEPLIRCPITMEGTFHSATIAKTIGSLIGYVTRASIRGGSAAGECTGGTATINQASLPWHITYEGFATSLPSIREIFLLLRTPNFALTITIFGIRISCGYGVAGERARGTLNREASGAITSLTPETGIQLRKLSGGEICPSEGGFRSPSQRPTVLGATTAITVSLI